MDENISYMMTPDNVSNHHFPRLGKSLMWLLLFTLLYFGAAMLYFSGYGIFLSIQHADILGSPEFHEIIKTNIEQHAESPAGLSGMYLVQFVILFPMVLWASQFKTQHMTETLGFRKFSLKSLGKWLLIIAGFFLTECLVGSIFEIDSGVFMKSINGSKSMFLIFTLLILAPFLEETIFRGYLFKAWRHTRLGLSGTLIVTSVLFTLVHWGQYGWIQYVFLFALSVLLGLARERVGSIWVPIILHSANNLPPAVIVVFMGAY